MRKEMRKELLIVDPLNDFCDPNGALYVKGAEQDCEATAKAIKKHVDKIADIHVLIDSHRKLDVAHPLMWIDGKGNHPTPFTTITEEDIKGGKWAPVNPAWTKRMIEYTQKLKAKGRYDLCIWPEHCLIGSWGQGIYPVILDALFYWEEQKNPAIVDFITKGSNLFVEHYSGVEAEVPDENDATTQLNMDLLQPLKKADKIGIPGQALSHCVAWTTKDIAFNFGKENSSKLVLLESSPVPGYEKQAQEFVAEMIRDWGVQRMSTEEFLSNNNF